MPLTAKGKEILAQMIKTYGDEAKAKSVFYASIKAGKITGAEEDEPEKKGKAEMTQPLIADFVAAPGVEQGGHVLRSCPVLFRCGEYKFPPTPDRPGGWTFTMTPDDVKAAIADMKEPVEIDDAHRPEFRPDGTRAPVSFFKGKLGTITNLRPLAPDDYSGFAGDWLCPKAINALSPDKPIHLSATFDPETKRLKKVSLTDHPRIPDAAALPAGTVELSHEAVFAAVAEDEARKTMMANVATGATFAMQHSPHGLAAMQMHHDMAAKCGALCSGGNAPGNPPEMAIFTMPQEREAHQQIHDAACKAGAKCMIMDSQSPQVKRLTEAHSAYYAEFAAPTESALVRELKAELATLKQERETRAAVEREATFAAGLKSAKAAADAFALEQIRARKAVRAEFADIRDDYLRQAEDDLRSQLPGSTIPAEVHFSCDGGQSYQQGSRIDALRARWRAKPELKIYGEQVGFDGQDIFGLSDRETPDATRPKEENIQAALRGAGTAGAAALKERQERQGRNGKR